MTYQHPGEAATQFGGVDGCCLPHQRVWVRRFRWWLQWLSRKKGRKQRHSQSQSFAAPSHTFLHKPRKMPVASHHQSFHSITESLEVSGNSSLGMSCLKCKVFLHTQMGLETLPCIHNLQLELRAVIAEDDFLNAKADASRRKQQTCPDAKIMPQRLRCCALEKPKNSGWVMRPTPTTQTGIATATSLQHPQTDAHKLG